MLAVQGRRYSPALDAFVKAARLRDWSFEVPPRHAARNDPRGVTTRRTPAGNRLQPIDPRTDALLMPNQTDKILAQIRTELLMAFSVADQESHSHVVG
ncbi:hypothetical protein AB4853_40265 [Bradyrhizobium sp. 1050_B9_N1_2]|uniref:hypothetical protein n=1 Tax=Bradyrhizobium sp. 1050_B9_N1_2 TaxID=3238688 RepID=UPI003EDC6220